MFRGSSHPSTEAPVNLPHTPPSWLEARRRCDTPLNLLREKDHAPIDIFGLCRDLGVEVELLSGLPTGFAGRVLWDETRPWARITLRADDDYTRQRFTMAHELGHLMLHPSGPGGYEDWADLPTDAKARRQEHDANDFATELLMPLWLVEPAMQRYGSDTVQLARRFNVSPLVASFRLRRVAGVI